MGKLIDSLELPVGLRGLSVEQLNQVAQELRDELIDSVASSGGHFASSLGAAELSVALHACFDTPNDRLVWDVGHQGYIHKMITGRRAQLPKIRMRGGPSGFLKRSESEFDTFGAGHAGTSISAAVGMSAALQRLHPSRFTVAIIGDGSLTAGMAFEALNNAGGLGLKNFIVVLNDNEMSISPNVGAISWFFSKAITSKTSTIARNHFKSLHKKGFVPEFLYRLIDRAEEATQSFIAEPATLFAAFGFRYIGPVDGHNMQDLVTAFQHAKQQDIPVLMHVCTQKGKGYEPAEEDPVKWHGVNPFDRSRGEFHSTSSAASVAPSYTAVFADAAIQIARENPEVLAITAAMPSGTGLDKFQRELPEQFFDVGICEQHGVTFAAGLACEGYHPICAIYSTFLQRAYDQVVHDVCIQNLPVIFAMDRGGVVGNDGETHQGVFDISYLRTLPNVVLMSPKDENELRHMLCTATKYPGPVALRYPRGNGSGVALDAELRPIEIGKAEVLTHGSDIALVCYGPMCQVGLQVAAKLGSELGLTTTVINARFAKPLDEELLSKELPRHKFVATVEDHALQGGFGSAVLEFANDKALALQSPIMRFGVLDRFVAHASQAEQHAANGYNVASIVETLKGLIGGTNKQVVGL
ncbi:MAG: 1-deoxy-D-xylulose-5-phosphate synthase [Oligoflexia bacterium]|nr:1-deoxy-D-xylulose-5-phosphate synthase [Oligoflexia bacterium]